MLQLLLSTNHMNVIRNECYNRLNLGEMVKSGHKYPGNCDFWDKSWFWPNKTDLLTSVFSYCALINGLKPTKPLLESFYPQQRPFPEADWVFLFPHVNEEKPLTQNKMSRKGRPSTNERYMILLIGCQFHSPPFDFRIRISCNIIMEPLQHLMKDKLEMIVAMWNQCFHGGNRKR